MWWSEGLKRGWWTVLLLSLGSCGFQFRSPPKFPPQVAVMHISAADTNSPFYRKLSATLVQGGIRLTSNPEEALTVINIVADETGHRLLSVTTRNVPAEYQVYYRVVFFLTINGGAAEAVQNISLTRDYAFDENQVLGKAREEDDIRRAIASDLVDLVTRRLAAVY